MPDSPPSFQGHFALILHAHLPFVRHPEHERFLEESWLFEAIVETYLPLIQVMDGWRKDGMKTRLTLCVSPTLSAMWQDPMLQDRFLRHLNGLVELAESEIHRTHWDRAFRELAWMYHHRFSQLRDTYLALNRDLASAFRRFQEEGFLEIATCAATHALLPMLASDRPSLRAQILVARDSHRDAFGQDPRGIWLPECAFDGAIFDVLQEANLRWFVAESHGLLNATPRPRYGLFAPIFTPQGVAAFGRDLETARQVWSRHQGYPGDARYRDFYRDVGFDLDFDYVKPYLPGGVARGFTGIKYHRITGAALDKQVYDHAAALRAADEHAGHFLKARLEQFRVLGTILERAPLIVAPYDAELFGHWWYEGPEFLNWFVRKAYYDQQAFTFMTPGEYLQRYTTHQVATPAASSWGEEGYWRVWLNETNEWIYPHLRVAQSRMTELAARFSRAKGLPARALRQAGRELLLAQASDWPFILRTGTSPNYAARRVKEHLSRFLELHRQLTDNQINEPWLAQIEQSDNIFPNLNCSYWFPPPA